MMAFQFGDPRSVQTARRLDRDHRRIGAMLVQRQLQLGDTFARDRAVRPEKLADLLELWDRYVEDNGVIIGPVSVYEIDAEAQ